MAEVKAYLYRFLMSRKLTPDYHTTMYVTQSGQIRFSCELRVYGKIKVPHVSSGDSTSKKAAMTEAAYDFCEYLLRIGKMDRQDYEYLGLGQHHKKQCSIESSAAAPPFRDFNPSSHPATWSFAVPPPIDKTPAPTLYSSPPAAIPRSSATPANDPYLDMRVAKPGLPTAVSRPLEVLPTQLYQPPAIPRIVGVYSLADTPNPQPPALIRMPNPRQFVEKMTKERPRSVAPFSPRLARAPWSLKNRLDHRSEPTLPKNPPLRPRIMPTSKTSDEEWVLGARTPTRPVPVPSSMASKNIALRRKVLLPKPPPPVSLPCLLNMTVRPPDTMDGRGPSSAVAMAERPLPITEPAESKSRKESRNEFLSPKVEMSPYDLASAILDEAGRELEEKLRGQPTDADSQGCNGAWAGSVMGSGEARQQEQPMRKEAACENVESMDSDDSGLDKAEVSAILQKASTALGLDHVHRLRISIDTANVDYGIPVIADHIRSLKSKLVDEVLKQRAAESREGDLQGRIQELQMRRALEIAKSK